MTPSDTMIEAQPMRSSSKNFATLIAAIALFLLGVSRSGFAQHPESDQLQIVPEIIVVNGASDFCVVRVNLVGISNEHLEAAFLNLIDFLYAETNRWRNEMIPVGVDYDDLSAFEFVLYNKCEEAEGLVSQKNKEVAAALASCNECRGLEIVVEALTYSTPLVHSTSAEEFELLQHLSPVQKFEYFRSRAELDGCTARFVGDAANYRATDYEAVHNAISVWQKYRMPMVDVSAIDGNLYMLFSQECTKKQFLLEKFVQLIEREYRGVSEQFGRLELA